MVRNVALLKMILVAAALAATATPARSDAVAGIYKGRTVSLIIGYSVGSGYDLYARLLARFIGIHPRPSDRPRAEHAGRGQPEGRDVPLTASLPRTAA